ncbi:hypothetical protein H5410_002340 [Solanum commersonii]|uniref:Uncharacterized protein n=1 Tax=Solanum commersonii TaxID=4109 RepID=A0A9J6B2K8_SOLCO|nr:hypothetical protein H5410_002340 [Solanum commersonii]
MQVQTQQRYSNALTTKMIPHSQKISHQVKIPESHTPLTLTKMNTCITSPIGLPLFSNQHLFQLTQDHKGLFKACNGVECQKVKVVQVSSKKRVGSKGAKQGPHISQG